MILFFVNATEIVLSLLPDTVQNTGSHTDCAFLQKLSAYYVTDEMMQPLKEAFQSLEDTQKNNIKSLIIHGDFEDQEIHQLDKELSSFAQLEDLNIRGRFGDKGALVWSKICSHIKHLKCLSIWGLYSDQGAKALVECFKQHPTLESVNIWAFRSLLDRLQSQMKEEFPEGEISTWYLKLTKKIV